MQNVGLHMTRLKSFFEPIWLRAPFFLLSSLNATFLTVITTRKTVNTNLSPGRTVQNPGAGCSAGRYSTTASAITSATQKNAFTTALTVSSASEPAIHTTIIPVGFCMPMEFVTLAATRQHVTGMASTATSQSQEWLWALW